MLDFGDLKLYLGRWLDRNLDHTTIAKHDDVELLHAAQLCETTPYLLAGEPTAENLAAHLFEVFTGLLDREPVRVCSVRVWETPNCSAVCP